jgi:hypothetical protein
MHNNDLLTQSHVELENSFDEYAINDWVDNNIVAHMIQNESINLKRIFSHVVIALVGTL